MLNEPHLLSLTKHRLILIQMVTFTCMLFKILVQTDGIILTGNSNLYGRDLVVLITKQTTLIRPTQHRFILIKSVRDLFYNRQWRGFT
jgi:hypothetical protein